MLSLLCLGAESTHRWGEMSPCQWPIHEWLVVSYGLVMASRLLQIAGIAASPVGLEDLFLLNLRPDGFLMKVLTCCGWLINLPLLLLSSLLGTVIFFQSIFSPECLPGDGMNVLFIIVWITLSYAWVAMHMRLAFMAARIEVQLRKAEAELHAVAADNADVVARWGHVSSLGVTYSENSPQLNGLSSQDIASLPSSTLQTTPHDDICSICVDSFAAGDCVRRLNSCGHTFHQSCIDLWLLRQADCPLCKQTVSAISSSKPCEP